MKTSTAVWIIIVVLIIVGGVWYFHSGGSSTVTSSNTATPVVTAVSPITGTTMGGDTVTITGTGFTGATAVNFGSVPASSFIFSSDTSITATSPVESAGPVDVTVATPNGTSAIGSQDQFMYNEPATTTATTTSADQ